MATKNAAKRPKAKKLVKAKKMKELKPLWGVGRGFTEN